MCDLVVMRGASAKLEITSMSIVGEAEARRQARSSHHALRRWGKKPSRDCERRDVGRYSYPYLYMNAATYCANIPFPTSSVVTRQTDIPMRLAPLRGR